MNLGRVRYQQGSLKIEKRKTGEDVWIYRWREYRTNGTSTYRKKIIGPVSELRTKTAAQKGLPKTETSRKPMPMSDELAAALVSWREQTDYAKPSDWVFASPMSFGKLPYWPDMLLRRHILPAAKRLGIHKRIGWHTFRRTAASLLMACGSSVKTTQELMRHATADITLELYAQAVSEDKREAQDALAALIAGQTIPPTQRVEIGVSPQLNLSAPAFAPICIACGS